MKLGSMEHEQLGKTDIYILYTLLYQILKMKSFSDFAEQINTAPYNQLVQP